MLQQAQEYPVRGYYLDIFKFSSLNEESEERPANELQKQQWGFMLAVREIDWTKEEKSSRSKVRSMYILYRSNGIRIARSRRKVASPSKSCIGDVYVTQWPGITLRNWSLDGP